MYHSLVRLLLVGLPDEARCAIEDAAPLEAFTHEVIATDVPDASAAAAAHLIIADGSGGNARALVEALVPAKGPDTDLVLIAGHDQVDRKSVV